MQKTWSIKEKRYDLIKLFWVFGLLFFLAIGFTAHAAAQKPASILLTAPNLYGKNFFTILINSPDPKEAPKNFRMMSAGTAEGLHASASAVLSKGQFEFLVSKLNSDSAPGTLGEAKQIHIIDTSSHAHGFVNNMQVVWLDQNIQFGSDEPVFLDQEKNLLAGLKKEKKVTLYTLPDGVEDFNLNLSEVLKKGGQKIQVQADGVETEQQYLKEKKMSYTRIPIAAKDISNLENKQIEQLVRVMKKMKKGEWLHFHNEEGAGNLSQTLVVADVLKNAPSTSLEEILNRQNVLGSQAKLAAVLTNAKLEKIYAYAKEQAPEYKLAYSDWVSAEK